MVNKRGEAQIGTIIAIVLGVAALAFLLFGFSTGWNNLWDRIANVGGGSTNFGTIKQSCEIACSSQDKDNYCSFKRTVKFGEVVDVKADCSAQETNAKVKVCYTNCSKLAESSYQKIRDAGFPSCPGIIC